jgi:hypothetical protein
MLVVIFENGGLLFSYAKLTYLCFVVGEIEESEISSKSLSSRLVTITISIINIYLKYINNFPKILYGRSLDFSQLIIQMRNR